MAAAARQASPTGATVPPIATLSEIPSDSRISRAARGVHFAGDETDSARPLSSAAVPKYNFEQKLEEADLLLLHANNSELKEKARAAYLKASEHLNEAGIPVYMRSLAQARCQIGLAFTYPYKSTEMNSHTGLGETLNNSVYESRDSWNDLDKRKKIVIYQRLIKNYKFLLALILISDKDLRKDLQGKMQACETILEGLQKEAFSTAALPEPDAPAAPKLTLSVPPPAAILVGEAAREFDMEAKFKEADSCYNIDAEKARSIFFEILQHLKYSFATDFLMKARCQIWLAYTYLTRIDPTAEKYSALGRATNDFVYDSITAQTEIGWIGLSANQKIAIYEGLISNYNQLSNFLFREETDRNEISDKIKKCEEQLGVLKKPALSTPPAESVAARLAPPHVAPPAAPEPSGSIDSSQSSAATPTDLKSSAALEDSSAPAESSAAPIVSLPVAPPAPKPTAAAKSSASAESATPPAPPSAAPPAAPKAIAATKNSAPAEPTTSPALPSAAPPAAPNPTAAAKSSASAESATPPAPLPVTPPPPSKPAATPEAPPSATAKPAANQAPRKVTLGPVGESSTIRNIFGVAIITLTAMVVGFVGVVIYKRYFVKK